MSDILSSFVKKWYIIHTYSGYEKKVKTDLEKKIAGLNLSDKVFRVIVPEEERAEIRRGKKKSITKKLFPGYVMIEMLVLKEETKEGITFRIDSEAWYIIRNTAGVTGFVGVGADPIPLEDEEVEELFRKIGLSSEEIKNKIFVDIGYGVGDFVSVIEGAFEGCEGKVSDINYEHKKVKVMIEVFGRMTPVEVSFEGVKKA